MPINVPNNSGGSWLPTLKFNAVTGEFTLKDEAGNWVMQEPKTIVGAFDYRLLRQGYFNFNATPPFKLYGTSPDDQPTMPDIADVAYGISNVFYSPKSLGNAFEFLSQSTNVINVIVNLHSDWEVNPDGKAADKVQCVRCTGIDTIDLAKKNKRFYVPHFEIVQYRPRPPELEKIQFSNNQYERIEPIGVVKPLHSPTISSPNGSIAPSTTGSNNSQQPKVATAPSAYDNAKTPPPVTEQEGSEEFF